MAMDRGNEDGDILDTGEQVHNTFSNIRFSGDSEETILSLQQELVQT